jgi:pimeloyl-ACP methyl ester carboxylesterase
MLRRWMRRIAVGFFGLVVVVAIVGAGYERLGRSRAMRDFPPPGMLVDIGGRRIHIDCRGTGTPVVVFEAGLDINGSLSWSTVHDSVAKTTRACAYSRAGIMWSDPREDPQNGKTIAVDLHAALDNAGERPPFVLVGHSLGGPYIMTYTKNFGSDVAGLVFVDASHPEQVQRFRAVLPTFGEQSMVMYRVEAALAWAGVVRASPGSAEGVPHQPTHDVRAVAAYASTSVGAMLKEQDAMNETLADAGTFRQLGDRPVFVLTAAAPMPEQALVALNITPEQGSQFQEVWKRMQEEQVSWSSRSQHQVVPDAGHYIQFDRPDIVIAAVRSVVESVRDIR